MPIDKEAQILRNYFGAHFACQIDGQRTLPGALTPEKLEDSGHG